MEIKWMDRETPKGTKLTYSFASVPGWSLVWTIAEPENNPLFWNQFFPVGDPPLFLLASSSSSFCPVGSSHLPPRRRRGGSNQRQQIISLSLGALRFSLPTNGRRPPAPICLSASLWLMPLSQAVYLPLNQSVYLPHASHKRVSCCSQSKFERQPLADVAFRAPAALGRWPQRPRTANNKLWLAERRTGCPASWPDLDPFQITLERTGVKKANTSVCSWMCRRTKGEATCAEKALEPSVVKLG